MAASPVKSIGKTRIFIGEWDDEGVYFYQAFNAEIAEYALTNQKFGGPNFNPLRMTWIKPSLAWALYRSGYATKVNQERLLKIKLSHATVVEILDNCRQGQGKGGGAGRVQWDPARDLFSTEGKKPHVCPRKMLRDRAIQIGVKAWLSKLYVDRVLSIEDKTELAHRIRDAHVAVNTAEAMEALAAELPRERPYTPACKKAVLEALEMETIES